MQMQGSRDAGQGNTLFASCTRTIGKHGDVHVCVRVVQGFVCLALCPMSQMLHVNLEGHWMCQLKGCTGLGLTITAEPTIQLAQQLAQQL